MSITVQDIYNEIGDRLNLDATVTANQTRILRWANIISNDIASRYPWPWLITNGFIQTVTDKTAGTVATTLGSASVVGTGTAFASPADKNSYLQVQGDTNWYEVTSISSQTLTLGTNITSASQTAATYTLRTTYYDLPSNCWKVFDVRQTNTPTKLTNLGLFTLDTYQPDINTTSNPTGYFLFGEDPLTAVSASKQTLIGFFPTPDAKYNIQIRYFLEMVDLTTTTTDVTIIPVPYYHVLLDGIEWLGNKFLNDPRESLVKSMYEDSIEKMIQRENAFGDHFPILQSSDGQSNQTRFLPFPGSFPSDIN